jgi:hypothetical protein
MDAIKVSDSKIQITKQQEVPAPIVQEYDYDFLIAQKARIIADANKYLAARQAELDEVNDILAQCEAVGIKAQEMPAPLGEQEPNIGG